MSHNQSTPVIGMFFDEMDRRIRSMQARGIQPCNPSADVYTPAGPKAVEHAKDLLSQVKTLEAEKAELLDAVRGLLWAAKWDDAFSTCKSPLSRQSLEFAESVRNKFGAQS